MSENSSDRKIVQPPENVSLVAEIEIDRELQIENPSLNMKLQEELIKPGNGAALESANDLERIERLKAPEGLLTQTYSELIH